MDNVFCGNLPHPQKSGNIFPISKRKDFKGRFAVQTLPFYAVDMGKNEVHGVLREPIKTLALWDNIPEKRMIFLNPGLLAGLHGVAEKQ